MLSCLLNYFESFYLESPPSAINFESFDLLFYSIYLPVIRSPKSKSILFGRIGGGGAFF